MNIFMGEIMKQKSLIDIDGKTYMSPSAAADKWCNISRQKIVSECKAGKIIGACQDSGKKWIIPIDTPQPIDNEAIRKILISILCIKNNSNWHTSESDKEKIKLVVDYLVGTGFLEQPNVETDDVGNLVLTDKGIHLATEGKKININWVNAGITLIQVIGSVASIWSLVI